MLKILFGLLLVLMFAYKANDYFTIRITIYKNTLSLEWFIIVVIIILWVRIIIQHIFAKTWDPFVIFFFWCLIFLDMAILYYITIEALLTVDHVKDYILQYENITITIEYTLKYKTYFAIKYLNFIYEGMSENYIRIAPLVFSMNAFQQIVNHLNFDVLLQGNMTLADIRYNCAIFITNYIDYRLQQANFIISMQQDALWHESFGYNFLLFLRNSLIILAIPLIPNIIVSSIPIIFLSRFYPHYFLDKALNIIQYYFNNYPNIHLVFEGTSLEQQDFFLLLAQMLLRTVGKQWIYEQPWY